MPKPIRPTPAPIVPMPRDPVDLPVLDVFWPIRTGKGWALVSMKVQGMRVLSVETMTEPQPRAYAIEAFKIEFAKRFIQPGVDGR